jgi:hypothetical protein
MNHAGRNRVIGDIRPCAAATHRNEPQPGW